MKKPSPKAPLERARNFNGSRVATSLEEAVVDIDAEYLEEKILESLNRRVAAEGPTDEPPSEEGPLLAQLTEEQYRRLAASGLLYERYPHATGNIKVDLSPERYPARPEVPE